MTLLVLFILALIWAAVLLPPWLQNRSENRPADSISSFRNQLSVLERRAGNVAPAVRPAGYRPVASSRSSGSYGPYGHGARAASNGLARAEVRRRRRDVLFTLLAAAGLTLVLAVLLGGPVLMLHLAVDVLLVAYVVLLARTQRLSVERETKVRYLPDRTRRPEPAFLLRRSAN